MLQIYVYGKTHQGFIDLPAGTVLNLSILKELFDEELTLGEYSLPLDVPWTDNNKRIFNFNQMLNTLPEKEQLFWKADVYNNLKPEMAGAKLTYLEEEGNFNYEGGQDSFSISGNKGFFGSLIAGKTLRDLTLEKITYAVPTRQFATSVMKLEEGYDQWPFMRFAPVSIQNYFDTERPDYNGEFLAQDLVNNIITTGPGETDWEFGRPSSADTTVPAVSGSGEYIDYRSIPFFTYKWILQKLFTQFGYTVAGEWLQDPAWDDAVMYNNFSLEKYTTAYEDVNREIEPAKHLPKKGIGIFLRDFQIFFNVHFAFKPGNVVSIDYRKSALKSKNVLEVSSVVSRKFKGIMADYKQKGFTFSFSFDSADGYNSERIKEVDQNKVVAVIEKFADFPGLVIGRAFEYNDLVYVAAENQYFSYTNGVGINAWEYFSEKLFPYSISPVPDIAVASTDLNQAEGEYKYETGISPMVTDIEFNEDLDRYENKDRVAASMPGTYYNKKFALVEKPFDTRIFYIKTLLKNGALLPISFVHSRDTLNVKRVPVSLAWDGDDGLFIYCWKEWIDFLLRTRIVKTKLSLNQKTYNDLRQTDKLSINGTVYLPSTLTLSIPIKNEVEIELYRL